MFKSSKMEHYISQECQQGYILLLPMGWGCCQILQTFPIDNPHAWIAFQDNQNILVEIKINRHCQKGTWYLREKDQIANSHTQGQNW
jgi:hypothetical protein